MKIIRLLIAFAVVFMSVAKPVKKIKAKKGTAEYVKIFDGTRLVLIEGNITKQPVDVIVNAANEDLRHGGGVARAISKAAGPQLQKYCKTMPLQSNGKKCLLGDAVITPSFKLEDEGIKHIIHAVGPHGNTPERESLLRGAYKNSLRLAKDVGATSIAFPAISTAIFGYDINEATPVALNAVLNWIKQNKNMITEIRFVVFSDDDFAVYKKYFDQYF